MSDKPARSRKTTIWWLPLRRVYVIDALIVLSVVVSVAIGLRGASQPSADTCERPGQAHRVQLADNRFVPGDLTIRRCDMLTIENTDDKASYNVNFGRREEHVIYPGYQAATLIPGETITIDAFVAGKYELHDHFRDIARLGLTITE